MRGGGAATPNSTSCVPQPPGSSTWEGPADRLWCWGFLGFAGALDRWFQRDGRPRRLVSAIRIKGPCRPFTVVFSQHDGLRSHQPTQRPDRHVRRRCVLATAHVLVSRSAPIASSSACRRCRRADAQVRVHQGGVRGAVWLRARPVRPRARCALSVGRPVGCSIRTACGIDVPHGPHQKPNRPASLAESAKPSARGRRQPLPQH